MGRKVVPFADELKAYAKLHGFTVIETGRGKSTKDTVIKCKCGAIETHTAQTLLKFKAGCITCRKAHMHKQQSLAKLGVSPANKKTQDEYVKELKRIHPKMELLGTYTRNRINTLHRCNACGFEKEYRPGNLLRYGCIQCSGRNTKTAEGYNRELAEKNITFTVESYSGSRTPTKHTCTRCNEFSANVSPTNALRPGKLRCVQCDENTVYNVKVGKRVFAVRGYERFAITHIASHFGIQNVISDLEGTVPKISLRGGRTHRPDFFIKNKNLLIEVKSINTAGLGGNFFGRSAKELFSQLKQKKRSAEKAGYAYLVLLISGDGQQIKLPKCWWEMTRNQVADFVKSRSSSSVKF